MIEVRRPAELEAADAIVATLRNLVVAFREVEDPGLETPVIAEGELVVTDPAAITAYLHRLARDVAQWSAFQSDACYIGDDGVVC